MIISVPEIIWVLVGIDLTILGLLAVIAGWFFIGKANRWDK